MLERFFILDRSKGQHFFHPFQMLEFSLGRIPKPVFVQFCCPPSGTNLN